MAHTPSIQLIASRGDKPLPDAAVPQIGPGRQRPAKADAAPARREIRSDERTLVVLRGEGGSVFGLEPAMDIVEVAPELLRVRRAEKGPKGNPHDALRFRQIGLSERANDRHELLPAGIDESWSR